MKIITLLVFGLAKLKRCLYILDLQVETLRVSHALVWLKVPQASSHKQMCPTELLSSVCHHEGKTGRIVWRTCEKIAWKDPDGDSRRNRGADEDH
jgi:hypothetical protein